MYSDLEPFLIRWLTILLRGLAILGPMYLLFWVLRPRWVEAFRIHQPRIAEHLTHIELWRSIRSLSIYMIPFTAFAMIQKHFGYSMLYTDIHQYGWGYFFLSILIFAGIVDTWFYWTHWLMHQNKFLRKRHGVHHSSYNITPVSAYSFDVVEGLINATPYFIFIMLVPWHPLALFTIAIFGIFYVGYIHLGYDFAFQWRQQNPILKWFYSATHHSIHHQRHDSNFGVYFTFWDKLMKTERIPEWTQLNPKS